MADERRQQIARRVNLAFLALSIVGTQVCALLIAMSVIVGWSTNPGVWMMALVGCTVLTVACWVDVQRGNRRG